MANYFKSKDVKIFPCAYRGQDSNGTPINPEASSFTEYNFTNIYSKSGLKKESFIISYTANELKCIIGGYYFEITSLNDYTDKSKYKYLAIKVLDKELIPFEKDHPESLDDNSGNFLGLAGGSALSELSGATAHLQVFDSHEETIGENSTTVYTLCESSKRLEDIISAGTGAYSLRSQYADNNQALLNTASGKHSIAFGEKVYAENDYAIVLGNSLKSNAENQVVIGTGITAGVTEVKQADEDASVQIFDAGNSIYKLDKTGNETIVGNLKTNGIKETAENVAITKKVELNNTLDVSENITANGALEVLEETTLNGSLNVDGATAINNTLTIIKSNATTTIDESGIQTNKAITATGDISTSADLVVSNNATISKQTTTSHIILNGNNVDYITAGENKLDKNGNLIIAGNITSEKIAVTKANDATTIILDDNTSINGNATIGGKLKSKYIEEDFVQQPADPREEPTIIPLKLIANQIDATGASLILNDLTLAKNVGLSIADRQYNDLKPDSQTDSLKINNNNAVCLNTGIDTTGPVTVHYTGNDKPYAFASFSPSDKYLTAGLRFDGTAYFKQKLVVGGNNINLDITDETEASDITRLLPDNCIFYAGKNWTAIKKKLAVGEDTYFGGNIAINSEKSMTFGNQVKINFNNTGGVIATSFSTSSDLRLKQNIKSYRCEKSILDLDVKEFEYINDKDHKKHIGAIAQEVQDICPEIVNKDLDGYLSIEENKLVYLLLNEVKELKKEIKNLKGD